MVDLFDRTSTTDEVLAGVDLHGKCVLVTGVSAGLGVETARSLAARGATVFGAARNLAKAHAALAAVWPDGAAPVELVELDLASLASARACADRLLADGREFDLVVANAGVMAPADKQTPDGFETHLVTNHLGHFVLLNRLERRLRDGGRVVMLSSAAHRMADVDMDDPGFERTPFDKWQAYGRSKTANVLFAVEFDRRHKVRGVRAAAVHPGGIWTELSRNMTRADIDDLKAMLDAARPEGAPPPEFKSIAQGAATTVWAGVVASGEEIGGRYCADCAVAQVNDAQARLEGVRSYALDADHAREVWTASERWVGERFLEGATA